MLAEVSVKVLELQKVLQANHSFSKEKSSSPKD